MAIIAHVDHGKTTLVDRVLRDCNVAITADRVMDRNELEKERGITIMSKVTSVTHGEHRINVIDTPGHADLGAEVERVLGLVDGAVLLVDATEGPMAQTKFVLTKALARGIRPLLVLNKVDRDTADPAAVEAAVFDLFASLDASDEQLDFTTLYASAKQGWTAASLDAAGSGDTRPLLDAIVSHVPPPRDADTAAPFAFLAAMLSRDPYLGRIATGRVAAGAVVPGQRVVLVAADGSKRADGRVGKILATRGLATEELPRAVAGDIVSLTGMDAIAVGDTVAVLADDAPAGSVPPALYSVPIDPPTVSVVFSVNESPLSGKDGTVLTSQKLAARLALEAENNVSISVSPSAGGEEATEVHGRGELQLGILIEQLRREGLEFAVSPPRVLTKTAPKPDYPAQTVTLEPWEELSVEVDEAHTGLVLDKLSQRYATVLDTASLPGGRSRLKVLIPARGLLGFRPVFTADTRGSGVLHRSFAHWAELPADALPPSARKGVLVSMADGLTSAYSLATLEARGTLFVRPREEVYAGMIIGECSRGADIDVNPVRAKQLTNIRTHAKDEAVRLSPPRAMTLETAIGYVQTDELVEVTPTKVRLRKRILDAATRLRASKGRR